MRPATVPCTFCATLNRVDLDRISDRPKCGACARPIRLDRPLRLTDATFEKVITTSATAVVVDFYADWCAPCKVMAPAIDELAHERAGEILVAKLDTEASPQTAMRFGIRSIPTLIVFENGREARRQAGALRREQIEQFVGLKETRGA